MCAPSCRVVSCGRLPRCTVRVLRWAAACYDISLLRCAAACCTCCWTLCAALPGSYAINCLRCTESRCRAVCCDASVATALRCAAIRSRLRCGISAELPSAATPHSVLRWAAIYVAICCNMLQSVGACCGVLSYPACRAATSNAVSWLRCHKPMRPLSFVIPSPPPPCFTALCCHMLLRIAVCCDS